MFAIIQFTDEDGGTVAIVNRQWFTPSRCEVHWPPVKGSKAYQRLLCKNQDESTPPQYEKWKLYGVQKIFHATDDIEKAKRILKLVEVNSDLQTEVEDAPPITKHRNCQAKQYKSSSDDDNEPNLRTPPFKKKTVPRRMSPRETRKSSDIHDQSPPVLHEDRVPLSTTTTLQADTPESNSHNTLLHEYSDDLPLLTHSILQALSDVAERGSQRSDSISGICDVAELSPPLSNSISATPVYSRLETIQTPWPNLKGGVKESPSCALKTGSYCVAELIPGLSDGISVTPEHSRFGDIQTLCQNLKSDVTESPCCAQKSGYQETVVSLLAMIKSQNDQILSILKGSKLKVTLTPEFKLPLKTFEELEANETLLKIPENYDNLVTFIKSIGGRNTYNNVSRVMKLVLADSLAKEFNFYGKRSQKKPFCELVIRNCIVDSIKKSTRATVKEIEDGIKIWLKHAPQRLKKNI